MAYTTRLEEVFLYLSVVCTNISLIHDLVQISGAKRVYIYLNQVFFLGGRGRKLDG